MCASKLQVSLALINDVQADAVGVDSDPLVGLEDPLDEFKCDGVLEIPAKVRQKEKALPDDPDIRLPQDASVTQTLTLLQVWLQFVPDALLVVQREIDVGLLVVLEEAAQPIRQIVLQRETLHQLLGYSEFLLQVLLFFPEWYMLYLSSDMVAPITLIR